MGCGQENFKLVWRCHQLLSGFLAKGLLPREPRQSFLSANVKGDNEMIPGTVHRSPGIYLTAEKNTGKYFSLFFIYFWYTWSYKLQPKKLHASVAVPPAPVRIPSQRPLAPSVTSVANDKGDNEMMPGAVHDPGICLTVEANPGKPQLGDRLMKELCDQSLPQKQSLCSNEVCRIGQHIRKG